ncbi:MAG: cytochrome BD quinol oxidase subunit I [Crenarchaeota archaeon]|nr:cytochrome BD quinol oxidase subunit I [Thermoproteota archaeon]
MIGLAPAWLAFMFGWHIAMVNLGIGLAWLVPYFKWKADKTGDQGLEKVARSLMRFYAATYGLAGVFGTAFTVFILSYYPDFLGVAGHVALIPFAISILMIALHFFAIVSFWYGWDRFSRPALYAIGLALGVSALLIPLGFRAVFGFLNIPAGLQVNAVGGEVKYGLAVVDAIARNPTTIPLYVKSIVAAFTVTFFAVMGGYAYKAARSSGEERELALRVVRIMAKPAAVGAVLMIFLGLWYALSLQAVPYKFNNVFASLGWKVADGKAFYDVSWLFILKMILFAVQFVALAAAVPKALRGGLDEGAAKLLLAAGVAAVLAVPVGEYLNAFSQYPFFIAAWPDVLAGRIPLEDLVTKYAVSITPPEALPMVVAKINSIVLVDRSGTSAVKVLEELRNTYGDQFLPLLQYARHGVNEIALLPSVVAITYAFIAFLTAAAIYFLYTLLTPAKKVEAKTLFEEY